jgi:hypothetical protein
VQHTTMFNALFLSPKHYPAVQECDETKVQSVLQHSGTKISNTK